MVSLSPSPSSLPLLLLLVAVVSASASLVVATTSYHRSPKLRLTPIQPITASGRRTVLDMIRDGEVDWERCVDIPVIGNSCIELYVFPQNLTLGARLIINGRVFLDEQVTGSKLCLDDDSLLELLEFIPALTPFKPVIDAIIKLHHLIPAEVFSECIEFTDLNVTQHEATGCVQLDSNLLCLEGKCVYKGINKFGCFDIKF